LPHAQGTSHLFSHQTTTQPRLLHPRLFPHQVAQSRPVRRVPARRRRADAPPLAAFGRAFSDREVLGGNVAASAFVSSSPPWGPFIFSALALGAIVVCAHGAFRMPEDFFYCTFHFFI
jgi:hypothetical protein